MLYYTNIMLFSKNLLFLYMIAVVQYSLFTEGAGAIKSHQECFFKNMFTGKKSHVSPFYTLQLCFVKNIQERFLKEWGQNLG